MLKNKWFGLYYRSSVLILFVIFNFIDFRKHSDLTYVYLIFYYLLCSLIFLFFINKNIYRLSFIYKSLFVYLPIIFFLSCVSLNFLKITDSEYVRIEFIRLIVFFLFINYIVFYDFKFFDLIVVLFFSIIVLKGLYQYFYGFDEIIEYVNKNNIPVNQEFFDRIKTHRIFSIYFLPNIFASILTMFITYFIYCFKRSKNFLYLILIFLGVYNLILTQTISVFVSIVLSIIIVLFLGYRKKIFSDYRFYIFLVLIVGLVVFVLYKRGVNEFYNSSVKDHIYNYKSALNMWEDNKLTGVGLGNFAEFYNEYKITGANNVKYPHNLYLRILSETGVIGFFIFITGLFLFFKHYFFKLNFFAKFIVLFFMINNFFSIDTVVISGLINFALILMFYIKTTLNKSIDVS